MLVKIHKKTVSGCLEAWNLEVKDLVKANDFQTIQGPIPVLLLVLADDSRFTVKFTKISTRDYVYSTITNGFVITFGMMWEPKEFIKPRNYLPSYIGKAMAFASKVSRVEYYQIPVFKGLDYEKIKAGKFLNPPNKMEVAENFARTLMLPNKLINPINFYYHLL